MVASTAHQTAGDENGLQYGTYMNSTSYPDHTDNPDCLADFLPSGRASDHDPVLALFRFR